MDEKQTPTKQTRTERFLVAWADRLEAKDPNSPLAKHFRNRLSWYREGVSLGLTLAVVLVLKFTVLMAFYIPSPSMANTLEINDRVFVNRLSYLFGEPEVGDIVVFNVMENIPDYDPEKPVWIKRIVAGPGDTVAIKENRLFLNGRPATDPPLFLKNTYYARSFEGNFFPETTVPEGHVMVFGDNSADSYDSRYWGPIPIDRIIGKAYFRYWPLARIGLIHGETRNPLPPRIVRPER
jgi:signal peptidase I